MADNDPVPVEVRLVVWVNRQGWSEEYGVDTESRLDYDCDFEEAVGDWVREECRELVESDTWSNVERMTE